MKNVETLAIADLELCVVLKITEPVVDALQVMLVTLTLLAQLSKMNLSAVQIAIAPVS